MGRKWQMNRRHTIADSVESVDRVVYRKNNRRISEQPQHRQQPTLVTNGGGQVAKKRGSESGSESLSSNSEFEGVTINFNTSTKDTATIDSSPMPTTNNDASPLADDIINSSCLPWEDNNCNLPWQDSNSNLPWEDNLDPSPTHLADSIPNNEPALAHVPSWVNNLSYSHITETGSPYVSPQTTIIPPASDYHKSVYSLFPEIQDSTSNDHNHQTEESPVINQCSVNSSDYFPTPWGQSVSEDCPQVSPMAMESAIRSDDLLHSTHNEQAPDHHHVIIPTNHLLHIDSSNSSGKHPAHLTEVASAPDFQHWKPISKGMRMDEHVHLQHLQSDSMLTEMAFQEGVKSRVQEWLKQADDDEENDADDDDDTDDDDDDEADCGAIKFDCDPDGLSSARDLQLEFDHAMTLENEKDTL